MGTKELDLLKINLKKIKHQSSKLRKSEINLKYLQKKLKQLERNILDKEKETDALWLNYCGHRDKISAPLDGGIEELRDERDKIQKEINLIETEMRRCNKRLTIRDISFLDDNEEGGLIIAFTGAVSALALIIAGLEMNLGRFGIAYYCVPVIFFIIIRKNKHSKKLEGELLDNDVIEKLESLKIKNSEISKKIKKMNGDLYKLDNSKSLFKKSENSQIYMNLKQRLRLWADYLSLVPYFFQQFYVQI